MTCNLEWSRNLEHLQKLKKKSPKYWYCNLYNKYCKGKNNFNTNNFQ